MTDKNNVQYRNNPTNSAKITKNAEQKLASRTQKVEPEVELPKRIRIRLIPIWLRVILVICLLVLVIAAGLTVGYSIIGDGEKGDVLQWSTWQHIIDIIRGVE